VTKSTYTARRLVCMIVAVFFVASCQRGGGVLGSVSLPSIRGTFVIEDDERTTPLTAVEHSVFYVIGNTRMLVFKGAGGRLPVLSLLNKDDILIQYCGGRIYKVESFFEDEPDEAHESRLLRLQPVTLRGMTANGHAIC
jgi:hypothetical protein